MVRLVDIETAESIFEFDEAFCAALAMTADGRIAAHANGGRIHLWDTENGKTLRRIERSGDAIFSLAFSPDGQFLVSGDGSGVVQLWETAGYGRSG